MAGHAGEHLGDRHAGGAGGDGLERSANLGGGRGFHVPGVQLARAPRLKIMIPLTSADGSTGAARFQPIPFGERQARGTEGSHLHEVAPGQAVTHVCTRPSPCICHMGSLREKSPVGKNGVRGTRAAVEPRPPYSNGGQTPAAIRGGHRPGGNTYVHYCAWDDSPARPLTPAFGAFHAPLRGLSRCQPRRSFQIDGHERLRWYFGTDYPRPFFHPLVGPSGSSLTRIGHPGAPNHDHHLSIWFAPPQGDRRRFLGNGLAGLRAAEGVVGLRRTPPTRASMAVRLAVVRRPRSATSARTAVDCPSPVPERNESSSNCKRR